MDDPSKLQPAASESQAPIRVLVVDDSAFMRFTISKYLGQSTDIQVAGTARDGKEALELIPRLQPDVITLDVEMPRMDGITALRQIMAEYPRPVIMLSSLTAEGAVETIQALTIGAVDFVTKPANKANIAVVMDDVHTKILRAVRARVRKTPQQEAPVQALPLSPVSPALKSKRSLTSRDRVVVIGSSTGGPRALNTVLRGLSGKLSAAVLVVQHMPVGFTRSLAERLDSVAELAVKEAEAGDRLEVGQVLVAPGGYHMTVTENNQIALNQNPPIHGVRPAIDVTLSSVAQHYGKAAMSVILTGMGSDGTNGSALIHSAGGWVVAEDESTCVVWGMPRSVTEAGVADEIVALPNVAASIEWAVKAYSTR
ncbi:MAG: chemotaxis response regulator protein-glutamate methylesterase [Anaerolineaceae bacterium]|nr:chemotaxis response regulator protein-glutamate methylesterase [Anaerolineaceae bacterium]